MVIRSASSLIWLIAECQIWIWNLSSIWLACLRCIILISLITFWYLRCHGFWMVSSLCCWWSHISVFYKQGCHFDFMFFLVVAAFKIIKSWLPAKAVQKIKFVNKSNLKEYVDPDQALKCWGGLDDYIFTFVPEQRSTVPNDRFDDSKKKVLQKYTTEILNFFNVH